MRIWTVVFGLLVGHYAYAGRKWATYEKLGALKDYDACEDGHEVSKGGFTSKYAKCADGSISFEQADYRVTYRTGSCGPTAMANIFALYNNEFSPVYLINHHYTNGNYVGTPPDELVGALNDKWSDTIPAEQWLSRYYWAKNVSKNRR